MQKYKHIFDTTHLQSDLKKRSLQSGAATISSQVLQFIIQMGSTMILARILTPQDYGINAMAVTITGFASMFTSLGLSTATIQRADITHEQVSTLFWINVMVGLVLTLITAALSPVAVWFYKTPEMLWVMLALSTIFTISGMAVQHSALLTRQMRFGSIAVVNVVSMLSGVIVAIVAAFYGFRYWALVFNTLTNVSVNTLGCWLCCRWIPGLPGRSSGVKDMIKFGSDLVGFNVINYFARNLDNVLIGRYHGPDALGIYSKAYQLLMMPITNLRGPITNVAMPALSSLQNDQKKYANYYLKCVALLAFLSMPLVAFMFVCSDQLIALVLGPQWTASSIIFKILAFAAFIMPVRGTTGMVLISMGRSRLYLIIGVINAIFICTFFIFGLPWGAKGIAIGYVTANFLLLFPTCFYTFKNTAITIKQFLLSVSKPFFASIGMGIGCFFLLRFLDDINLLMLLIICFLGSSVMYLIVFVCFSGGINELDTYYSYIKLIFRRK